MGKCTCGCGGIGGLFDGCEWIWIIILILIFCPGILDCFCTRNKCCDPIC